MLLLTAKNITRIHNQAFEKDMQIKSMYPLNSNIMEHAEESI